MKSKSYTKSLLAAATAACIFCSTASHAVIYIWTGAVDGDWNNAANWDANGVPVSDTSAAGTLGFATFGDRVVINSTNFDPTVNVPTLRADHNDGPAYTPTIDVINGSVAFNTSNSRSTNGTTLGEHTFATIGDGDVLTGLASLTYNNLGTIRRDGSFNMAITVNSDGSLNFGGNNEVSFNNNNFNLHVTLAGGAVNFGGTVTPLRNNTTPGDPTAFSWFDFTELGSTFTAGFGSVFEDLNWVNHYINEGGFFRSTTSLALAAVDNGDGTFTVLAVPEPSTALLLGLAGMGLALRRRR